MRLRHLTLVFVIIFFGIYISVGAKRSVSEKMANTEENIKRSCRAGALGAAEAMADLIEGGVLGNEDISTVDKAFFDGASAAFCIEAGSGNMHEKLENLFPILLVCDDEGYVIISRKIGEDKEIKRAAEKKKEYGKGITLGKDKGKCISVLEKVLEELIRMESGIAPIKGRVEVDLPDYALDVSVNIISGPSVLAVALIPDIACGAYKAEVYGAQISERTMLTGIIANGRKEVHSGKCKYAGEYMEVHSGTEYRLFGTNAEAAAEGFYPAECCDPLGFHTADTLCVRDGCN